MTPVVRPASSRRPIRRDRLMPAIIDALEDRQLFAAAFPTAQEQYLIELINRARANPTAEVTRLSSSGSTPVALSRSGWAVTASNNPADANAAIDGNTASRWSSNGAMSPGMYYQVDFGAARSFNRIEMDSTGSSSDFAASYAIYTSNTGDNWDTQQPIVTGTGLSAKITAVFTAQNARFVRIVQTGSKPEGWWWSIHELNVYTTSGAGEIAGWGGTPDLNEGLPANTITPDAKQPVAVDPFLVGAARDHSAWMQSTGNLSHEEGRAGFNTPTERAITAGYVAPPAPPTFYTGENIFWSSNAVNQTAYVDDVEAGLFIDNLGPAGNSIAARGHRGQMLNPLAKLIGVGHSFVNNEGYSTEDFTNVNNSQGYLTGVAYNDTSNNNFYTPGEGLGGVTITATRISDGQVFTTTTWDAGGYTLKLSDGAYTVTASGGSIGTPIPQTVTIAAQNVKVDWQPRQSPPPPPAASAPTILQQPANVSQQSKSITQFVGSPVTFTSAASGTPAPTYQWQSAPAGSSTFTDIPGATSAAYTFTPVGADSGRQFRCVATNAGGSATSNAATLSLTGVGTYITAKPQDQTVNVGQVVTLNSASNGLNSIIKWESLQTGPGSDYAVIAGATSPSYSFTATPEMAGKTFFYRVTYTNAKDTGFNASAVGVITVNAVPVAPVVAAAPTTTFATAGNTATLATVATGFPTNNIQWQVADAPATANASIARSIQAVPAAAASNGEPIFTDVPGLTGSTVTFPVTSDMNGKRYRAVITNSAGTVVTQEVTLNVNNSTFIANELANLKQRVAEAKQALIDCKQGVSAAVDNLNADLDRLNATKAQKKLVSTLYSREEKARKTLDKHQSKVFKALIAGVKNIDRLYARVLAHSTDTKAQAKLATALTRLQATAAANTVPSDAARCVLGVKDDLAPIAAIAPSDTELQAHVIAASNGSDNIGQQLQAPMVLVQDLVARLATNATPTP